MRGVNLDVFDFDYDLTWMAFFLGPHEEVYGRYGSRDAVSPDNQMSLEGLRFAMTAALAAHGRTTKEKSRQPIQAARTVDTYPAARRRPANACIHCHQVYDFRREALQAQGKWGLNELWVYPQPENVGVTLDIEMGNRVKAVAASSPAGRAGLRAGDLLKSVNGVNVASIADVQYGLHRAPAEGEIPVTWTRSDRILAARLPLAVGWRKTDISWRWSLKGLEPSPWVQGEDLTVAEKRKLGLSDQRLAFYQNAFVSPPARQAGIRQKDIILGIDGKELEMTARQFTAYVKLNYKVDARVTYNILRDGKRLDVALTLISRPPF